MAGRAHFRLEEEVLLPAFAAHGDAYHPLVAHVLCDHVAIRQQAEVVLGDDDVTVPTYASSAACSRITCGSKSASCSR